MPLVQTRGAASAQGFGEFAQATAVNYIEDVFSTFLYTGNSSTQTITNGIDLSTKGGLVWIKRRTSEAHYLFDTSRGVLDELNTDGTGANETKANSLTSFNTTGFSLGSFGGSNYSVAPDNSYVSWTWRKQPKYFDIQTWTGTGSNTTISHSLGAVPACIIVKRTDTTSDWQVYHRSLANTEYLVLNTTAAKATGATRWNSTTPTSAVFSLGTDATVNASSGTYVAYLFAHDAGGFGLTGTDNVISCGSYTGNGSATGPVVTLGYEPQWVMIKRTDSSTNGNWQILDIMRGMSVAGTSNILYANLSGDESASSTFIIPTATGFQLVNTGTGYNGNGATYIYIAIRRGPMKVPTSGTSVFAPVASSVSDGTAITAGFPVDMQIYKYRDGTSSNYLLDRLRGVATTPTVVTSPDLLTNSTNAESLSTGASRNWTSTGFGMPSGFGGVNIIFWNFKRAPSFFDEVCYTGTGSATTFSHNLGVVPEMMIVKNRSSTANWMVYVQAVGNQDALYLNGNFTPGTNTWWNNTTPTASVFTVGTTAATNASASTYAAYLFATCAGVSKVGSYTGTGTTLQIDCGFTAGARFVLIKRTDSTGDWYVWDSARGIIAGNDPYLLLNDTAAEVTGTDYVDTYNAGFEISSTAPAGINANGGTYIFLAIA